MYQTFNQQSYQTMPTMYQNRMMDFQQLQPQSLIRVNGIEGAKAYQMSANSQVALFDSNEDIMYVKITDGAGFPTIRTFKFNEIIENQRQVIDSCGYVKQEEFETFKKEVAEYVQQFIQQQSNNESAKQDISTNGISEQLRKSRSSIQTNVSE